MKIIHCADLHLDSRMTSNLSKEKATERKKEILRTFTRMVDYAAANGVRAILIAGDLFDTRKVSNTARNAVKDAIVMHPDIDFLYLRGNHDQDNFLSKLEELPSNIYLFSDRWTSYNYGQVVISGLELEEVKSDTVFSSLVLEKDQFNIVMLHGQVQEHRGGASETIPLSELKNKNIDYLALGHVHEFKIEPLDARGAYCYAGCLEGRGFDECGAKGFVMVDIDEVRNEAKYAFVPFASREIVEVSVDVEGAGTIHDVLRKMEQTVNAAGCSSKNIVKLVLSGEVPMECEINTEYLQEAFADYFFYVKVVDHTTTSFSYSDYEKDASLKGEFIRMVLSSDLDEAQKTKVIRTGIQALSGEEL